MPNTPKTQKEMMLMMSVKMDSLDESHKGLAKNYLQLSADFSNYINKSDLNTSKILGYLESDSKTNQKGIIEQQQINTFDINEIKTGLKVNHAKKTLIGVVVGAILTFLAKVFF